MSRNTIVLYGHFGSGNIGNDSSFEAAFQNIRRRAPAARIVCVCSGPEAISRRFGIEALPITSPGVIPWRRRGETIRSRLAARLQRLWSEARFLLTRPFWFRRARLFVVVGTGAVDDMAVRRPWDAPYDLLKWCVSARLGAARVVFLSVGVGPVVDPVSRSLMLGALRLAHQRSYRDAGAVSYLHQHGIDASADGVYPDLVFSLDMDGRPRGVRRQGPDLCVGLGLINYRGWRHDDTEGEPVYGTYVGKMKAFLMWLLEQGHSVRLLVGDDTDRPCVDEMMAFVTTGPARAHRARVVAEPMTDVQQLLGQIAQTEVVVASRFHNVVCSLMMERPVISIGYHEKNDILMAEMGLGRYCGRIEACTVDWLADAFRDCVANRAALEDLIGQRLDEYRRSLDEQYARLLAPMSGEGTG